MKVDFLSCTKMLYLAERLAQGNFYPLPEPDGLTKQTGLTEKELEDIYDQFQHDKILRLEDIPTEIVDNYGNLQSEMSYDGLVADQKKLTEYITYTKKRYQLRQEPVITREAIASIAEQLQEFFGKEKLIKIIDSFSGLIDMSGRCFENGTYSLTDILFRHAYADAWIEPLSVVLAEFLNPIHYGIRNKDAAVKIFDYIDHVLSLGGDKRDYEEWTKQARKYLPALQRAEPRTSHSPEPLTVKIAGTVPVRIEGSANDITPKNPNHFPHKLPAGTTWNNITIRFIDSQKVSIRARQHEHETNYADMGFSDKRSAKPDQQWALLHILALNGGEITWKTSEANKNFKKTKGLLSKALQSYFSILEDPFYPYHSKTDDKAKNSYKIRICIFGHENESDDKSEENSTNDDIADFYKNETPQI